MSNERCVIGQTDTDFVRHVAFRTVGKICGDAIAVLMSVIQGKCGSVVNKTGVIDMVAAANESVACIVGHACLTRFRLERIAAVSSVYFETDAVLTNVIVPTEVYAIAHRDGV